MKGIFSKVRHGAHVMLLSIMVGANIATMMLLWFTCLSTYLDPATHPRLSQAGLLFPVFLLIDLLFLAAWLIVSWKHALLPVIGVLCCWNFVREYVPVNLGPKPPAESYRIMSFNVANLVDDPSCNIDGQESMHYITSSDADIVFLQECPQNRDVFKKLKREMKKLGYQARSYSGLTIFSKYDFVGKNVYEKNIDAGNGSFACMINLQGDTVLLVNNHLQSNAISIEEKNEYSNAITQYDKDRMSASGRILLSRLSNAAAKRAEQVNSLCTLTKEYEKYGIILAGDLNDTPVSYTCQQLSKHLKSSYVESGNGLGISFNRKGFPVRIDHIYVSETFETFSTHIDRSIKSSDHLPIITNIYRGNKTN